jgi:hypothetical protein
MFLNGLANMNKLQVIVGKERLTKSSHEEEMNGKLSFAH